MPPSDPASVTPQEPAGILRRLAAGVYDLLPLAAILMLAAALVLPLTGGRGVPPGTLWFQLYLLAVAFAYYGLSWRRGGQTIGMKAWRIRVTREDGTPPTWGDVAVRFAIALVGTAALGVGLLAALFDPRRRMWHDVAAGTLVLRVPRR